jgi:hypothetical protein
MNTRRSMLFLWLILVAVFISGCAMGQATRDLSDRYVEIATKIDEAETLGARDCAPRELAYAKVELDHALHEVNESYYPPAWLNARFDKAESVANEVLTKQRIDANQGACR